MRRINIVGMAVSDDKSARKQMSRWAKLGGGAYFDARNPKQLGDAIRAAVSAPFEVFDAAGVSVARGTVGGAAGQGAARHLPRRRAQRPRDLVRRHRRGLGGHRWS